VESLGVQIKIAAQTREKIRIAFRSIDKIFRMSF
jgi:hypothetical protein